ncbi:MAG: LysM peptidoglycan-binding domain-containing protein [Henriciella sp.]|uniref:LysM peptidoglycan-binding domain-containing protein n=1 Tax=Henriciella sp. TaxID=1968823 RepID=UPI003C748F79
MTRQISMAAAALSVLMTACSHGKDTPGPAAVVAPLPPVEAPGAASADTAAQDLTRRQRAQLAIQLLDAGLEAEAEVEIDTILALNPENAVALKLREQIEADPETLLGESHTPYTVQPGETLSTLAKAHLGDALLFYALSRYNELEAPNKLMAGQTLKMPERAEDLANPLQAAEAVTPAEPGADGSDVQLAEEEAPEQEAALARLATPTDVVTANALRMQALQQLNAGNAERATSLLRRALSLDQNNRNIAADLEKAERIQAALSQAN